MNRHRRPLIAPALVGAAVLALAACGSSSKTAAPAATVAASVTTEAPTTTTPPTTAKTSVDPCDLVPKPQAESAIGMTLQDGVSIAESSGDGGGCLYAAPPTGPTGQLEVFVGIGAKTYYDTETRLGHTFKDVPNVGDEAHEEDSAIFARKGQTWIAIRITTLGDSAPFAPKLRTLIGGAVDQV